MKPGQERKELEGVFVVRDGKAVFEPVKTGIAGEKYFEIISGLKEGDNVIVGPFASVRTLADGAAVKVEQAPRTTGAPRAMNYFLESATIALQAIWANKLRSFLTVLGNIVAVTSIIAVVSLIQGMNAYVTDTIVSGVGADNFTISAHAGRADGSRRGAGAEQPPDHPPGRGRRPALQRQRRRRRGAVAVERQRQLRQRDGRWRAGPRRHPRLRVLLDVRRRARTADQPG